MTIITLQEASFLIIDDEESMRDACAQILLREGYQVRTAHNGEQGLEMVREVVPDVVLLDLKMPKMSGMAALGELNHTAPDTVKVVITAYATISSAMEAVRSGAYDFLPKPFTPEEVRTLATRAIEKRLEILKGRRLDDERLRRLERLESIIDSEIHKPVEDALTKLHLVEGQMSGNPEQLELLRGAIVSLETLLR